jgi:RNA polymerase sigma-70 factor (ECF subfamily)
MEESDVELVRRYHDGDPSAFAQLVDRYSPQARAAAERSGLRDADCDDVVQETMIALFKAIARKQTINRLRSWIVSVAKKNAVTKIRKRKRHIDGDGIVSQVPSKSYTSEGLDVVEDLWQCVRDLDPKRRQVFELRYFQELSIREIITQLGIPENTLGVMLARARNNVRECLERKGHSDLLAYLNRGEQ